MEKHFELSDAEFEQEFVTCKLDPSDFSHEAHLRLAWIHIDRYGIGQAEKNIPYQLQKFVDYVGAKGKFNMTLTLAAVKAVYHFMLKSDADNFKELMDCHYGFDIYNSNLAKTEFLEPDLIPFD